MRTIVVASEKGGVGKSTLAVHLAAALALRGKRVLLIDGDPQGHATLSLWNSPRDSLYRWLVADASFEDVVYGIAVQVYSSHLCQFVMVPGNIDTYQIPAMCANNPAVLKDALCAIAADFDMCLIDTGPTPGYLMTILYAASDYALVPTETEFLSIAGMQSTLEHLRAAGVKLAGIVPNKYRKSLAVHQANLAHLQASGLPVWDPIADRVAWKDASHARKMVWMLYPKSAAVRELNALVDRVEGVLDE